MAVAPTIERPFSLISLRARTQKEGFEFLEPGERLKILEDMGFSSAEMVVARGRIREEQKGYWMEPKRVLFRFGMAGEGKPCFDDMISRLPVRSQFAEFVGADASSLVVDLGAGSANMAASFHEKGVVNYVAVDNNPSVQDAAARRLASLGLKPLVLEYDIYDFPAEKLRPVIEETGPARVDYVSNWALTYGSRGDISKLIHACLDPKLNGDLLATVSFNMITEGKFNPKVLALNFITKTTPHALVKGRIRELVRAYRALPQMIAFGKSFTRVSPIWYPDEMRELIEGQGLKVVAEDSTLLWGQSTAMKVSL